jgi:hypothetical protein
MPSPRATAGYPDAVLRPGGLDPGTTLLSNTFSSEALARVAVRCSTPVRLHVDDMAGARAPT